MLRGADATTLKAMAVGHLNDGGESMYHRRIMLPPQMKQLLMMRSEQFSIRCVPCVDGIIMYRQQRDTGRHILVSLANSSDIHDDVIDASVLSNAQIFKFNYGSNDPDKRFFVVATTEECGADNEIASDMTIQEILCRVEKAIRSSLLDENNYGVFPMLAMATQNMDKAQILFHDPNNPPAAEEHKKKHGKRRSRNVG